MSEQLTMFHDGDAPNGETVLVEGEGDVYQVRLGRSCSCGHAECLHYKLVEDLLTNNGKRYLSWVKSGLHKEVRRGNFEAAYGWAKVWERVKRGAVRQYIRKIWFEESRNVEGLKKAFAVKGWELPLYVLCRSPKDWELEWDVGWASPEAMRAWGRSIYVEKPDISAFEGDDIEAALTAFWRMGGTFGSFTDYRGSPPWNRMVEILRGRANDAIPGMEIGELKFYNDELSCMIDAAFGRFKPEEANFFANLPEVERPQDEELFIPRFREYTFDAHTSLGRKRLKQVCLDFEKPMTGVVDLRLSGDGSGTLWRYLAHRQFGTVEVAWEDVSVEDELKEAFALLIGKPGQEG